MKFQIIDSEDFKKQHAAQTWKSWPDDKLIHVATNPVREDGTRYHQSLVRHAVYEISLRPWLIKGKGHK